MQVTCLYIAFYAYKAFRSGDFQASSCSVETHFLLLPLPLAVKNFVNQLDPFWWLVIVAIHGEK